MTPILVSQSNRLTEFLGMKTPAPRGRPRKRTAERLDEIDEQQESQPVKRKRGRPRKYHTAEGRSASIFYSSTYF